MPTVGNRSQRSAAAASARNQAAGYAGLSTLSPVPHRLHPSERSRFVIQRRRTCAPLPFSLSTFRIVSRSPRATRPRATATAEGHLRPGGRRRWPGRADRRHHCRPGRPHRDDGRTQPDRRHLREFRLHAEQVATARRAGGVPSQARAEAWLHAQGRAQVDFAAIIDPGGGDAAFSGSFDAVSVAAAACIDVFLEDSGFVGPDAVEVDGQRLQFRKALIATGSGPAVPDLPGLAADGYLTNETVFELTELPQRVVCIGAGIVNCELAQALCRLGSEVDLVGSGARLLPSEAPAASERGLGNQRGGSTNTVRPAHDSGGRQAAVGHAGRRDRTPIRRPHNGNRRPRTR